MEVLDAIRARRSIRKYEARSVSHEMILSLIESARLAPSGSNTQPWAFVVVQSERVRRAVAGVCRQDWMLSAPLFIVCVADIRTRVPDQVPMELTETSPELDLKRIVRDTTIAIEHMVLQAQSMHLSTCWVGDFTQAQLRPVLGVPSDKYVVAVLTLGYAAETPKSRPRKPIEQIWFDEAWGGKPERTQEA